MPRYDRETQERYDSAGVTDEDHHNADRVASWSKFSQLPYESRLANAKAYGPNWASILSGCGDQ